MKAAHPVTRREWDRRFTILRQAVSTLPQTQAAMFMLADEGFASVFEQVIAAIISVRTTEEVTLPASRRLLTAARTPAAVADLGVAGIAKLISPCTFAEGKARDIMAIAVAARDDHNGTLPCDVTVLDAFRGVGPKVANLAIAASKHCDEAAGIPVDIHVHRIANRWGVIATSTPEKSQLALEAILPREYWAEINRLLVPFGKFICTGVSPKCSGLPRKRLVPKSRRDDASLGLLFHMARRPINPPSRALLDKATEIHRRLCDAYGCPIPYFHSLDPLSELISSSLSHRTRNADSGRAFKTLRARFPTWHDVMTAPTIEVETAISACTWPELKAPRIQEILRRIDTERNELSLDFLADYDVPTARAWLEQLPGVGKKTSAAVLSFSLLRKAALPVDSHHHRVAERLELIPPRTPLDKAHDLLAAQLPPDASAQFVYDNHEVLMLHGQRCCFFAKPACQRCPLLDLCPTGQFRLSTDATRGDQTPSPTASSTGDGLNDGKAVGLFQDDVE